MYARLVRRSLWQRKSRALVALAALTVATTLTAALLNLYFDATRKLRSEFRRYGANLMLTPRAAAGTQLLEAGLAAQLEAEFVPAKLSVAVPYLYAVVEGPGVGIVGRAGAVGGGGRGAPPPATRLTLPGWAPLLPAASNSSPAIRSSCATATPSRPCASKEFFRPGPRRTTRFLPSSTQSRGSPPAGA